MMHPSQHGSTHSYSNQSYVHSQQFYPSTDPSPSDMRIPSVPTVLQPSTTGGPQRLKICRSYLKSFPGVIRILIIIFQMGGWISIAAVPKIINAIIFLAPEFSSTRDAYLVFSIAGFLLSIGILLLHLLNIVSLGYLNRMPWMLIVLVTDVLWLVPTFVLAVVCAVREGSLREPIFQYLYYINIGAFGAGSCFAFLCALLYGIDGCYHLMAVIRGGINVPPSYAP